MSNAESTVTALREAAGTVRDTVDDLQAHGRKAAARVEDAAGSLKEALDDAIRTRPYTTLAAAAALGFLYAIVRRR
jgi:ElaB/YqjD/DUF883 family membrane-anchored ribosome-binding protein